MTAVATDPTVHVDSMIKMSVVRQTVYLHPGDRLAGFPAFTDGRKSGAVWQNLALTVAIDAGLRCWQIGVAGHLNKAVAVTAIHSQLFHVQSMGEGNRLVRLVADPSVLWGEIIPDPKSNGRAYNEPTHQ